MDSIIFDLDGTLWDSTPLIAQAWNTYLWEEFHLETNITSETLKSLFGQPLPDIARQLFPHCSEEEQLRRISGCCEAEHRALTKKAAPLYPQLRETLDELSPRLPLFIVSNCQSGYIELFLHTTGLSSYFSGHLCYGDTEQSKAQNISSIIQKYHLLSPVYVGDTLGDYQSCQKAGIPFVFASYGFGEVPNPDYIISCPRDLLQLL